MQKMHICPVCFRNRIELLIGGHDTDNPVAGLNEGIEHVMVGSGSPVCCNHFFRSNAAIKPADAGAKGRGTLNVTIRQAFGTKRLQECIPVGFAEGKERIQRDGIHTGFSNVVLRPRLIGIHPLLNGERFDFHRLPPFLI